VPPEKTIKIAAGATGCAVAIKRAVPDDSGGAGLVGSGRPT